MRTNGLSGVRSVCVTMMTKKEYEYPPVEAQPEMQRGVSRGILHKNTVSRKISRLAARVKALAA